MAVGQGGDLQGQSSQAGAAQQGCEHFARRSRLRPLRTAFYGVWYDT